VTNLVTDTKEFFNVAYVEVNSNNFANVGELVWFRRPVRAG
jgi:hypothetical protein